MKTKHVVWMIAVAIQLAAGGAALAGVHEPDHWSSILGPDVGIGAAGIGCMRYQGQDGYDGQQPRDLNGKSGVLILHYRQYDPITWNGPTGFFSDDWESPIPWGGSKTWSNTYLWAQNYAVPSHQVLCGIWDYWLPPVGYTARLVLDYVPVECGWTGPMEFDFDLTRDYLFTLPVAEVTDPLQGTRMHITVYAPVPEPSAAAALAAGLAGLVGTARRRRGQ